MKSLLADNFLRGLLAVVAVAFCFPALGKTGGTLALEHFINPGIALVFFLHGMGIPREQLSAGLKNWRLHSTVQAFTFIIFPLLFLMAYPWLSRCLPPLLLLGFFYLCALPSTISSSVALTGMARGNVPAAIFNATASSLIGIVLTPLLVGFMFASAGSNSGALPLRGAVINIATLLLLPFLIGQVLHTFWGAWFLRYKKYTGVFDKSVILLLVLTVFSDATSTGLWAAYPAHTLLITFLGCAVLLAVVIFLSLKTARAFGFSTEDEITAVFCSSKKSLAAGIPMAKIIFGAHAGLGLIVLPIMFYHQLQIIVCSVLAQRYAKRPD